MSRGTAAFRSPLAFPRHLAIGNLEKESSGVMLDTVILFKDDCLQDLMLGDLACCTAATQEETSITRGDV